MPKNLQINPKEASESIVYFKGKKLFISGPWGSKGWRLDSPVGCFNERAQTPSGEMLSDETF